MKNNLKIFLGTIIFITLFSCSSKEPVIPELSYKCTIDTLHFEGGLALDNVSGIKCIDITTLNDSTFVYIKSSTSDTLYKYYYNNKFEIIEKICLPEEYSIPESIYASISGKTKYGKLNSMKVINKDSIIFMHENLLSIYNLRSKSIDFKFLCNDLDTTNWYLLTNNNPVQYCFSKNQIYTELIRFDIPENSEGVIETELNACIDIKSGEISSLPYKVPSVVEVKDFNYDDYFTIAKDKVICSFSINPIVYIYDTKRQKLKTMEFKASKQDKSIIKGNDSNKGYDSYVDSYLSTFLYSSLVYDNTTDRLIRTFIMPIKRDDEDYTFKGKPIGLSIYNKDLELMGEIITDITVHPNMWFAFNGEIYSALLSDKSTLKILKINYEI